MNSPNGAIAEVSKYFIAKSFIFFPTTPHAMKRLVLEIKESQPLLFDQCYISCSGIISTSGGR
jgi:hypothetical protein